jgi:hypothetical protein
MAHVVVHNPLEEPFPIPGLYVTVRPKERFEFDRPGSYVAHMPTLIKAARKGRVKIEIYYTPEDIQAGTATMAFDGGE